MSSKPSTKKQERTLHRQEENSGDKVNTEFDTDKGGRGGILCQRIYGRADYPGYLTMGVPVHYGARASEVVRALVADPRSRHKLTNELLRHGDIERALVAWGSILRHIVLAPAYPLARWTELKVAAEELIDKTASPHLLSILGHWVRFSSGLEEVTRLHLAVAGLRRKGE